MRKNIDMLHGPLYSEILRYSIPVMLTSIIQLLFNAADLVIVGQYCGSITVGAVSATGSIINLMVNLFIGLSMGVGVNVAHGLGSKQDDEVHRTVHTALPTALVGGALLTILGIIFADDLLKMMKTPPNVLPLAALYMRIYFSGIIFTLVYNYCASILRAAGDTKSPLIYLTISGTINVILNIFFVTVFHMSVDGVALATIISQAVSAVLVVIALMRRTDACKLYWRKIHFYRKQFIKTLSIGLPAGLQSTLFNIANVTIQSSINSFGSDALLSGNGSAANIEGFVYVIQNSFLQTSVNFVGQNAGAHQFDRIKKIFVICLGYVTLFGFAAGFTVWLFGEQLLSIYITDSADAISYGLIRFNYIALPYFLAGLMEVTTGALRGLGSSLIPMIISLLGACGFRILWIYTIFQIPQYHSLPCLYQSYPISWILTFVLQTIAFILIYNKKAKKAQLFVHKA